MPAPQEVTHASRQYEAYARALIDRALLQTHNQVYAITRAILHETRDHLDLADGIRFAQGLPVVLRAIFVEGWDVAVVPRFFLGAASFHRHVVERLSPHVVPPDTIVEDVVACVTAHADPFDLTKAIGVLPPGLASVWQTKG